MYAFRRPISYSAVCGLLIMCFGCGEVFKKGQSLISKQPNKLPAIATSRNAVQLVIVFVERPVDDPLLGFALWQEVDQIGALDPKMRQSLHEVGFRVGVASSSPPRALQSMLGLESIFADDSSEHNSHHLTGRKVVLRSGAETEIQASPFYSACSIEAPASEGGEVAEYQNARCVFRVKVQRLQDGWAKLEFLPEIHHGANQMRYVATAAGWRRQPSQKIEPLFSQRFEITLNLGEMAVITADGKKTASLGRHFFIGAGEDEKIQRLLVVQLAEMGSTQPVYADK